MPLTKKPAIAEQRIGDRPTVLQVANIRQRIEQIEALLMVIEGQANQSSFTQARSNASISNLQTQINVINSVLDTFEDLLLQENGLVVLADGSLITRQLVPGSGITITFPDGVSGNPTIAATGTSVYPFLTNELDDDILTESDHRIRIED